MKQKSLFLIMLTLLLSMVKVDAFAWNVKVDGIYYDLSGTEATVTYGGTKYSGNIVIPETFDNNGTTYTVTSIGPSAFYGCYDVVSVKIPNTVTSIGNSAFYSCDYLKNITIPNSVTSIGSEAFYHLSRLTNVSIGSSVTSIGQKAFYNCSSLTNLTMYSSVTSIGEKAFYGCDGLTSVTFHCPTIGNWFKGFTSIRDVVIGDEVTSIGSSAFYGCTGLTSVTIGNSVTSIGSSAFYGCDGLTSVEIPNSVTSIGSSAFYDCDGLTSVTIGNSVTSIGQEAFYRCSGLTTIEIPNSVTSIGYSAFGFCRGLTSVHISDLEAWCNISFEGNNNGFEYLSNPLYYAHHLYIDDKEVKELVIPNSVTSIGKCAFYGAEFNSVTIGTGVLSIGGSAFYSNTTSPAKFFWLANTPPDGYSNICRVNYVPNEQYTNLSSYGTTVYKFLSSMFEVDGVRYVPVDMSERTCDVIDCVYDESSEHIKIGETVSYKGISMTVNQIAPYAFYGNNYIKDVELTGQITAIGNYTFASCESLEGIEIPNSVDVIGNSAFSGCSALSAIEIPQSVTSIGNTAFSGCSTLSAIEIPQSVTSIGARAFSGCTGLMNLTIADRSSELTLDKTSFADCALDEVYIGGKISYSTSSSDGSSFYRNTTLRSVTITDQEVEIYPNEFYGCTNLQNVTIGDGVTTIGDRAFSGCSSLSSFTIGASVETIGQEAFSDCTALTRLTSRASTPPTCGSQALDDVNKWECTLDVPEGMASAYQEADQWKDFFFMEEGEAVVWHKLIYMVDGKPYKTVNVVAGKPIVAEEDPVKAGYVFSGWTNLPEEMPDEDVTVRGYFNKSGEAPGMKGDMNGDDSLDMEDVTLLINKILGKE